MAVSDLTGTTWVINSTPLLPSGSSTLSLNFTSNSQAHTSINIMPDKAGTGVSSISYSVINSVYGANSGWLNENYRTVEITGGSDATSQNAIGWFEANAVQQITVDDVVISYNGSDIASMTESGTKTLETDGKLCLDDIVVTYTKPSAPSGGGSSNIITFYTPT